MDSFHSFLDPAHVAAAVRHVVPIRHDLHRHPELGFQEHYTSRTVQTELTRLGVPFQAGLAGGTGVLAHIAGPNAGAAAGPCVALRADMDALPIAENTGLPYASTRPGHMHACGHDGHTAILLATAAILKHHAAHLPGVVKLIFQPSEEANNGGKRMCDDGVLDNPRVQAIFGLHGWPGLKVGTACTKSGVLLAAVDSFEITITGRGTHGAYPSDGIDPIVCAAALVQSLQTIAAREVSASEGCVVSVGSMHAGNAFNVIPDSATLIGTLRTLLPATRAAVKAAVERLCAGIGAAHRCRIVCAFGEGTPATINTPEFAEITARVAECVLGPGRFFPAPGAFMWGEDFSNYLGHVPGCFFALGVAPPASETYPMLHNDRYDFNDDAILPGVRMMIGVALETLDHLARRPQTPNHA